MQCATCGHHKEQHVNHPDIVTHGCNVMGCICPNFKQGVETTLEEYVPTGNLISFMELIWFCMRELLEAFIQKGWLEQQQQEDLRNKLDEARQRLHEERSKV